MGDMRLNIMVLIKAVSFVIKRITRFPAFRNLKYLFGPLMRRKRHLYISIPYMYLKGSNGGMIQAVKNKYDCSGGVRSDLPWVRPHDSEAASEIKVLYSDFIETIDFVPDEEINRDMMYENLICIGGHTNWLFWQYVEQKKCLAPLEYRIDRNKGIDGYYDLETDSRYESKDSKYSYGLLAVVKNTQADKKKIVFISGLDADATLEITKVLRNNLKTVVDSVKAGKLHKSDFYCIFHFTRTGNPQSPLLFNKIIVGKISAQPNIK